MSRLPHRVASVFFVLALVAGCTKSGGPTGPDPAANISFRPVTDVLVDKVLTPPIVVNYPEPIADGGVAPLTVKCTPPSGTLFPAGVTTVTCTATDGVRFAESHFKVTVVALPPVISVTKFLAFGDSITAGEVQTNAATLDIQEANAYPTVLGNLLSARYFGQTITMVKRGQGRETAVEGTDRLFFELAINRPEVLLLLEGINDINDVNGRQQIPLMALALRTDIRLAIAAGVKQVFVSTLLPMKPSLPGYPEYNTAMPWISEANDAIRAIVSREPNAVLVDGYAAMVGQVQTLIGGDGLHPTVQGYAVLAQTFMTAIQGMFELPPGSSIPSSAGGLFVRPHVEVRPQPARQPIGIRQRQQ